MKIKLLDEKFCFSFDEDIKIKKYWEGKVNKNPKLFNGPIFNIKSISNNNHLINIDMNISNYAHYSYMLDNKIYDNNICKAIAVGGLIVTNDNTIVLGKMNDNTSFPNIIQCIGGGIDKQDIIDGFIDPIQTLKREFKEEIGIDLENDEIEVSRNYITTRKFWSLFGICYIVNLNMDSQELYNSFEKFRSSSKQDEIKELVFIKNDTQSIINFCKQNTNKIDYLEKLLLIVDNSIKLEVFAESFGEGKIF